MANNLFISYDLMSPGQDYEKVTDTIKNLGSWAKVHYSLFYVSTPLTETQAAEEIRKSMDSNDKLMVINANNAYWNNLPDEITEFIQSHWNR